jgi:hypothetical protein
MFSLDQSTTIAAFFGWGAACFRWQSGLAFTGDPKAAPGADFHS